MGPGIAIFHLLLALAYSSEETVPNEYTDLSSLLDKVFGTTKEPDITAYQPITPDPVDTSNNSIIITGGAIKLTEKHVEEPNPPTKESHESVPTKGSNFTIAEDSSDPKNNQTEGSDDAAKGERECSCVPYYLCANDTITSDGLNLIDIRFGGGLPHPCKSWLMVCCGKEQELDAKHPITPKPKLRRECGLRNTNGVGFRISGNVDNEAQFGEFPWMVAILKLEEVNGTGRWVYRCGGALIHENVVLTAAHCVASHRFNASLLRARAGEYDTQIVNEPFPHQNRFVSKVIVHEKFYAGALFNDVALLIVDEPYNITENVDIICLPNKDDVVLDESCWASGWGKNVFGQRGKYQVILKRIELPMVPRDKCELELKETRLGPKFQLHESFVCAGGIKGRDTCKGDGGSPLVCPVKGKPSIYQQVGIVAWGIGCGGETPAAYVDVAKFRQWIDNEMEKLGYHAEYDYSI